MRAINLNSSAIRRACYDDEAETLSLWFRDSGRYDYFDVPAGIYQDLKSAASAGRYFAERIKGRFLCRRADRRRRIGEE